jgi:multicomponent Na+:H+ antiporter subunit D
VSASVLAPGLLVVPLLTAGLQLVVSGRVRAQRALSIAGVGLATAMSVALLVLVERDGTQAVPIGAWPAPYGIIYVADVFACLLLAVSLVTVLFVLLFAIAQLPAELERRFFHPLYLVLTAGVSASFLTGDLFHLFVAFEVMLIASYVLLTLAGGRSTIRPAMTYVVVNLLASTLFITAVGLVYAATGTVNMADLAGRVDGLPGELQVALSLLLLLVFGIKAAIFPLFFWLPDSYPTAPAAISAVFAGLLTKVGVYAIIRTQTIIFHGDTAAGPDPVVLFLAGATMVVGVLGAIAQDDVKRILSFHIVSQIGYMIFGLGLYTAAGLAAATLFIAHQIPVKTSLFLVGGMVESMTGTGALARLGGLARRTPLAATLFLLAALSLAGLPPFSGFFGKLALITAGFSAERWLVTGIALTVSLLTLFSMVKIWNGVFWGLPDGDPPLASATGEGRLRAQPLMAGATIGLVAFTLAIAVAAEPLYRLSARAGDELADRSGYVHTVLGAERALAADAGGTRP